VYNFHLNDANFDVDSKQTAHHMTNLLLFHYHNHPADLNAVATTCAEAFAACLNEFGSRKVLSWQLFGTQGYIQAYVEDGIEDGRDEFQNWQDLHNAFFSGFREAFLDGQPILEAYFIELNAQVQEQEQQGLVEENQGDEMMAVEE
jgi:hypothetical protein